MLQEGLKIFGLGFGTVFVGLICLILIISLMSRIFAFFNKKKKRTAKPEAAPVEASAEENEEIVNRGEFIAAVSTAIATVMGKDVSGIRILSVKKIDK